MDFVLLEFAERCCAKPRFVLVRIQNTMLPTSAHSREHVPLWIGHIARDYWWLHRDIWCWSHACRLWYLEQLRLKRSERTEVQSSAMKIACWAWEDGWIGMALREQKFWLKRRLEERCSIWPQTSGLCIKGITKDCLMGKLLYEGGKTTRTMPLIILPRRCTDRDNLIKPRTTHHDLQRLTNGLFERDLVTNT